MKIQDHNVRKRSQSEGDDVRETTDDTNDDDDNDDEDDEEDDDDDDDDDDDRPIVDLTELAEIFKLGNSYSPEVQKSILWVSLKYIIFTILDKTFLTQLPGNCPGFAHNIK